ncbi:hypothetical protein, partial [Sphingobacterium sp. UBA2074]|uniref:hypothetical protein n=1 Tax=Sphingobacterium sp. UBA2074 TaxID=1947487 RepID=UPI00257EEB69
ALKGFFANTTICTKIKITTKVTLLLKLSHQTNSINFDSLATDLNWMKGKITSELNKSDQKRTNQNTR